MTPALRVKPALLSSIMALLFLIPGALIAQPVKQCSGIWVCRSELQNLPTEGPSWDRILQYADRPYARPNLSDQNSNADVETFARALVWARTGSAKHRDLARQGIIQSIGTEDGGETLALGRNLLPIVIAADLIDLNIPDERVFKNWLREVRDETLRNRTLRSTHEDRPNNWGTHAGASRIAAAIYLGDQQDIRRSAQVFKGWMGDRSSYFAFRYRDPDWQADQNRPVGINPVGSRINGHNVDGVLPDDQRRCCDGFTWPPPKEGYVWEALQGVLAQAVMLHREGYEVWEWEDRALLRAYRWLHTVADYPAEGDDTWQTHLVNYYMGTAYPVRIPSRPGKNIGFTDWTHGPGSTAR